MSLGHIDCSCPTCTDDVALLAKFLISCNSLERISSTSAGNTTSLTPKNQQRLSWVKWLPVRRTIGCLHWERTRSRGVYRRCTRGWKELLRKCRYWCQSANGTKNDVRHDGVRCLWILQCCSDGHCAPLESLCPAEDVYGLETYCLRTKDVQQLEQLQRSIMKRIQCLPIGTATSAYGLLGIRPIQQELDIRILTLLGNVLLNKNTLEYEIARRQLAVKSIESKS